MRVWAAYLVVFASRPRMSVSHSSGAAIGTASVLGSQGRLNIAAVLIVAAIGTEASGLMGDKIGDRWSRQFL